MQQLSVRLPDAVFEQLDVLASERGVDRTRVVRQLLEAGLRDRPMPTSEPPSRDELLALLYEKARMGNVSAIRSALAIERGADDPQAAALAAFARMIERRP